MKISVKEKGFDAELILKDDYLKKRYKGNEAEVYRVFLMHSSMVAAYLYEGPEFQKVANAMLTELARNLGKLSVDFASKDSKKKS